MGVHVPSKFAAGTLTFSAPAAGNYCVAGPFSGALFAVFVSFSQFMSDVCNVMLAVTIEFAVCIDDFLLCGCSVWHCCSYARQLVCSFAETVLSYQS